MKIDKNTAIHLDIYETNCIDLMTEFLFWILIGNLYKINEEIIYLPKDTEIYIEIPNGPINFFEKISILKLIPQIPENKLSINNLDPLIVSREINSKVQIVCNFLKIFKEKKIDDYNLNIPGVTLDQIKEGNSQIIDAKVIPQNECQELIFEAIKENNKNNKFINYYQIQTFIDFLAYELIKFNNNIHFNVISLVEKHLRSFIIDRLIKLSKYFAEVSFSKIIDEQKYAYNMQYAQYDEDDDNIKGVNYLDIDKYYLDSFDKIEQSLIFFHGSSNQTFSYITNKSQNSQEYNIILSLINSQYKNNYKRFPEYNNEKFYFLQELKLFLGINNPLRNVDKNQYDIIREKKSLEEISNYYAFSSYNYNKMILILLHLRANIPIIMMGETGCGKTALIKQLYELKNNGNSNTMKILKINEETTDDDIINFIEKILPEAEILEEIENKNKSQRDNQKILYEKKKIWVFLDEINKCKSMKIISELMLHHSYLGKSLSSNIVFIGACYPYRLVRKKERIYLKINQFHKFPVNKKIGINLDNRKLAYNVNPIPHSLLNFVFYFTNLEEKEEKQYISKIIEPSIIKIFKKCRGNIKNITEIERLAEDMIFEAQKFIKDNYDISSVSLRDVKRFNIVYEFFFDYLKNKKGILNKNDSLQLEFGKITEYDLQKYAINLAIYICYYIRISNKNLREKFVEKLNEIFKYRKFLDIPLLEMKFIIDNADIPKNIAKNKALSECIFSLFCAINTRIPLFIIGKSGLGKSLSVQLIYKSMKGKSSKNEFFKNFPELVVFPYQGSLRSTSEGVETIFKKANNSIKKFKAENKGNISMIFFDEIGLAEHSSNNPLKVIHSQLEINSDEEEGSRAAFVGISNWVLDAAKMNRGLHISLPELDEDDIINTAETIAKSYDEKLI